MARGTITFPALARIWPAYKRLLKAVGAICILTGVIAAHALAHTSGQPRTKVHTIIVHAVSGPRCEDNRVVYSGAPGDAERWKGFFDKHPFLSVHYIVDRAGKVLASTPENRQANHALRNNEGTIGIELVHNGDGIEPFSDKQIDALIKLMRSIRSRHPIAVENVRGHAEVDTRTFVCGRLVIKSRQDPGANFPWTMLRHALEQGE